MRSLKQKQNRSFAIRKWKKQKQDEKDLVWSTLQNKSFDPKSNLPNMELFELWANWEMINETAKMNVIKQYKYR